MKKNLLLLSLLVAILGFSYSVNAQSLLTESFDGTTYPPNGWTTTQIAGTGLWKTLGTGGYPSTAPKAGTGQTYFNSFGYSSGTISILSTPSIDLSSRGSKTMVVEFYMFRDANYSTTYDSLTVMINTTNSVTGATWLGKINRYYGFSPAEAASGAWYKYSFTVPTSFNGTTNYVIFQGYSMYGSDIFMDEVSIYYPTNMTYSSSAATAPPTTGVSQGSTNNLILGAQVVTANTLNPLSCTQLTFNTSGSSLASDITSAKVWYSGTNSAFSTSTATLLGTVANPNGAINYTVNQTLATGTNYFWLTYDINANAVASDVVKAQFNSVTVGGSAYTPNPTSTSETRKILVPLSGSYTVGTGGNYANFTAVAVDLNTVGIKSNVTFNVISDITEPAAVVFNKFSNANIYTTTIQPSGGPWTISANIASTASGVFVISGANLITFDGGTSKNLTIKNTYTSSQAIIYMNNSGVNYTSDITFKNIKVTTSLTTSTTLYSFFVNVGVSTSLVNNIVWDGVEITGSTYNYSGAYGIYFSAAYINNPKITNCKFVSLGVGNYFASGTFNNGIFSNNTYGTTDASLTLGFRGIYLSGTHNNCSIFNNSFSNIGTSNVSGNVIGIEVAGTNTGCLVYNNNLNKIYTSYSGGYGAYGIAITGGTTVSVYNNSINDISTMNYANNTTYEPFGIRITAGTGHQIYHNIVNMTSSQANVASGASMSAALIVIGGSTLDIRNNIFINTMAHNIAGSKSYAAYFSAKTYFTTMNYNNYYASGSYAMLGYVAGDQSTMANFKSATGFDANSANVACTFKSAGSDWHFDGTSALDNNLSAAKITTFAGVNTDMDGEVRRSPLTQMGLDEVNPNISFSQNLTTTPNQAIYCNASTNVSMSFTPTVTSYTDGISRSISSIPYTNTWYKNGTPIAGQTATSMSLNPAYQIDSASYYATCNLLNKTLTTNTQTINVQTPITIITQPISSDICSTTPQLILNAAVVGTITGYQWEKEVAPTGSNNFASVIGETKTTLTLLSSNPLAPGRYRLKISGPGNCGANTVYTNMITVNIANPLVGISAVVDQPDPSYVCTGTNITFTANGSGSITGYQWQKYVDPLWVDISVQENATAITNKLYIPFSTPLNSASYRCNVFGSPFCTPTQVATNAINLKVWPLYNIVSQPASQNLCFGNSTVLYAYGDGVTNNVQWQKDGVDIPTSVNSSSNTGALILSNVTPTTSGSYRCKMNITDCRGPVTIYSKSASIYVIKPTEITTQPTNSYADLGQSAQFAFDAHVSSNYSSYPPVYTTMQWYKADTTTKPIKITSLVNDSRFSGTRSNLMTVNNVQASDYNYKYFAVVTGVCANATTDSVKIKAQPGLKITVQPTNVIGCLGTNAIFTVTAVTTGSGTNLSYQWYFNGKSLNETSFFSGTKTNTLKVSSFTNNELGDFTCLVNVDNYSSTYSKPANLSKVAAPKITTDLPATLDVANGKPIALSVVASGTNLNYVWMKDNTALSSQNTANLNIAAASASDAGVYFVNVTNQCGDLVKSASTIVTVTAAGIAASVGNENDEMGISELTPNPVSDNATIKFSNTKSGNLRIAISNSIGKELATIYNQETEIGNHQVNFATGDYNLVSGTYFITLHLNGGIITKPFVIVK